MRFKIIFICLTIPTLFFAQSRINYFTSIVGKDSVKLNFTITQGPSCGGYYVYKGSDSINLSPVYVYPGLCGNSNYPELHSYFDLSPNKILPNYYRIMVPPGDYSKIIRVDMASENTRMLIFPQPTESVLHVALTDRKNFNYEMKFVDRFGKQVGTMTGYCGDKLTVNVESFPLGIYVFYLFDQTGNFYRGKFSKL